MNSCKPVRPMLSRYLDGDLPSSDLVQIKSHLEQCNRCSALLRQYATMKEVLSASFSEESLPRDVARTLLDCKRNVRGTALYFKGWRLAALMTVVTLAIFSVIMIPPSLAPAGPAYIIESNGRSIMDLPLGSFVYYENLAGTCVHSPFVRFSSPNEEERNSKIALLTTMPSYESPLFNDRAMFSGKEVPSYE